MRRYITFNATEEEYSKLKNAAALTSKTLSKFIRDIVADHVKNNPELFKEAENQPAFEECADFKKIVKTFTLPEVAKIIGISNMTLYRYIHSKRIRAIKYGGRWRITEPELYRFLSEG